MLLRLTNSLSKQVEDFLPLDNSNVRMYVCGPTVYDRAHLGNIRSAVVYDLLFRLLKQLFNKVTYVRNVTDIDDKIINASKSRQIAASELTSEMLDFYHQDLKAIGCLSPTFEPKATEHLNQMFALIESLLAKGYAYIADQHVLFDIEKYCDYGILSKRNLEEIISGSRIEIAPFKKNPADFVLWKPTKNGEEEFSFASPWGIGRPGWHIECSAMSTQYLGSSFDIHGGGADLIFPHHENEIAQTVCAIPHSTYAKYWVHNGFLTVEGEKMSKSLGNFKTAHELLEADIPGKVIRYFYFTSHYRKPLDFNTKALNDAYKGVEKFSYALEQHNLVINEDSLNDTLKIHSPTLISILKDDLNTPAALRYLHELASQAIKGDKDKAQELQQGYILMGFASADLYKSADSSKPLDSKVQELAEARLIAKKNKNWKEADKLRDMIGNLGYNVKDLEDKYVLEKKLF